MNTIIHKLIALEKHAEEKGFIWPTPEMALDQLVSECEEVRCAIADNESRERLQEEVGDILHAAFSLCLFLKFDVEETLIKTTEKFEKRFAALLEIAHEQGYFELKDQPIKVLLSLWDLAKKRVKDDYDT
jgi:uncharacterized protein YabN with tetrapyrrole methylase and pyrophosphatase domain